MLLFIQPLSHRDPKVEPAGLGSGAAPRVWRSPRVWRQSTVACDFTLGPDPSGKGITSAPALSTRLYFGA